VSERRDEGIYIVTLYVRPAGRGVVLHDAEDPPHVVGWVEQALREAVVLGPSTRVAVMDLPGNAADLLAGLGEQA
jgi:hypothetical protein